jgi:NAD(P)H-dependent FMN reductase
MGLYLPILYGTVRTERKSIRVAEFVLERLSHRPDVETRLFDPRDLPFGNLTHREWEWKDAPGPVGAFVAEMARADGFVVVTPEYNRGYPGTLKNLFDHLYDEWGRKPFGLIGAGGMYGGVRAIEALRVVVGGIGGIPIPSEIAVIQVGTNFAEGGPTSDREGWERRLDQFLGELEWYARALQNARRADGGSTP